ncbi:MAG TPA: helix-turn-helix domain-containing protein, partial [Spirochaetota bacterium]|nr:helix-turn-helix domain-containing protein [Spirochaetota bacterium]
MKLSPETSAARVLHVVDFFSEPGRREISLKETARQLGLAQATLLRILKEMISRGYIYKTPQ